MHQELMLNCLAEPHESTISIEALPGRLDIKSHSLSIILVRLWVGFWIVILAFPGERERERERESSLACFFLSHTRGVHFCLSFCFASYYCCQ